jgi:hypothetical protein
LKDILVKNLFAVGLLLACGSLATAGPIYSVTLNSLGAGEDVTVQIVPVGSSGLVSVDAFAGVFNMTLNGQSFATFCIDTSHEVTVGQTYMVEQTPVESGLTNGAQMEYIYSQFIGTAINNDVDAAALQIALWDLVNGGQSLLTGSTFRYTDTSSPIYAQAEIYIADALAYTPPPSGSVGSWEDASASGDSLGRGQSLIGPPDSNTNSNTVVTPAPPGGVLALSALASLGMGRLVRRRFASAVA